MGFSSMGRVGVMVLYIDNDIIIFILFEIVKIIEFQFNARICPLVQTNLL